jgi:hypothetical protein
MVLTNRSAMAFACGARTGVLTTRIPPLPNTWSNEPLHLPSRSRISKRALVGEVEAEIARLLGDPRAGRVGRAAGQPHAPARVCDEEQRVVAAQEPALDGEEVAGDDARGLSAQELAPPRT